MVQSCDHSVDKILDVVVPNIATLMSNALRELVVTSVGRKLRPIRIIHFYQRHVQLQFETRSLPLRAGQPWGGSSRKSENVVNATSHRHFEFTRAMFKHMVILDHYLHVMIS